MRSLLATALILATATTVHAASWYLMAADMNLMSAPSIADRMNKGARIGPVELTSQGVFPSREQCEPARDKLIGEWDEHRVAQRGGWRKYGLRTSAGFIRCVPATDPHLKPPHPNDPSEKGPFMHIYMNVSASRM